MNAVFQSNNVFAIIQKTILYSILILSIGMTKYVFEDFTGIIFSISIIVLLCYQLLLNFLSGISFLVSIMLCIITFDRLDLQGFSFALLAGSISAFVMFQVELSQKKRVSSTSFEKFSQKSFLIVLLVPLIQYGYSIWVDTAARLRINLLSYDLVAHSYITRAIAICDSSIKNCSDTLPNVANSDFVNGYPDAFHAFFASIYRNSLVGNTDEFLLSWNLILVSAYAIALSMILGGLNYIFNTSDLNGDEVSDTLELKFFNPILLLMIGIAIVYTFNLGYLNFAFSISLTCCSIFALIRNRRVISFCLLLVACEFWTFLYLLTPLIFLIILWKFIKNRKSVALILSITYFYFLSDFVILALNSTQAKAIELNGNRVLEPVVVIFSGAMLIRYLHLRKQDGVALILRNYLAAIGIQIFLGWLFLFAFRGITGSYYIFKAVIVFAVLQCLSVLYLAIFVKAHESNQNHTRFDRFKYFPKTFQLSVTNLLYGSVISLLLFWSIPTSVIVTIKSIAQSPLAILLTRLQTQDIYYQRSVLILDQERYCTSQVPCVLLEPEYWYQSTQWINNLNLSWTDDIQNEIDSVYASSTAQTSSLEEILVLFKDRTPSRTVLLISPR